MRVRILDAPLDHDGVDRALCEGTNGEGEADARNPNELFCQPKKHGGPPLGGEGIIIQSGPGSHSVANRCDLSPIETEGNGMSSGA